MKRPLITWIVFAVCALIGLGVLGWFSAEMIRLERGASQAREIAAREESVRLALWRMDSALASIHGLEAARPPADYSPFVRTERSFSTDLEPRPAGTMLVPSPLLGFAPPFVRLHIQVDDAGTMSSPQAPEGPARLAALRAGIALDSLDTAASRLDQLRRDATAGELLAVLETPLPAAPAMRDPRRVTTNERLEQADDSDEVFVQMAPQAERQASVELLKNRVEQQQRAGLAEENYYSLNVQQKERTSKLASTLAPSSSDPVSSMPRRRRSANLADTPTTGTAEPAAAAGTEMRATPSAKSETDEVHEGFRSGARDREVTGAVAPATAIAMDDMETKGAEASDRADLSDATAPDDLSVGPLQASWLNGELFLARRVSGSSDIRAQAVWLDWPELHAWLLSRISDLLPGAELEPISNTAPTTAGDASRRLAFLPARLRAGPIGPAPIDPTLWSPLRSSLALAWTLAGVGVGALALLLAGTLRLSERRAAFVSAVTHELRTPLTTFRMYTEMLSGGMVPSEERRRSYLDTLRREAERLSHLVENVLSYARLERGRASRRIEETTPGDLLARMEERLRQRAEQGGLSLTVEFESGAAERPLRTDTTAFEQIVFNLVDNAAKYARRADGAGRLTIHVAAAPRERLVVRVSDNGPGIAASVRRRLFQPFSKSATEAAHSQPGVGLGLALSRRLARDELHGELSLESTGPDGTVFRLEV